MLRIGCRFWGVGSRVFRGGGERKGERKQKREGGKQRGRESRHERGGWTGLSFRVYCVRVLVLSALRGLGCMVHDA